jgi:hypothetical protein
MDLGGDTNNNPCTDKPKLQLTINNLTAKADSKSRKKDIRFFPDFWLMALA